MDNKNTSALLVVIGVGLLAVGLVVFLVKAILALLPVILLAGLILVIVGWAYSKKR